MTTPNMIILAVEDQGPTQAGHLIIACQAKIQVEREINPDDRASLPIQTAGVVNTKRLLEQIQAHRACTSRIIAAALDRNMWGRDVAVLHARILKEAGVRHIAVVTDDTVDDIQKELAKLGAIYIPKNVHGPLREFFAGAIRAALQDKSSSRSE